MATSKVGFRLTLKIIELSKIVSLEFLDRDDELEKQAERSQLKEAGRVKESTVVRLLKMKTLQDAL